VPSYISAGQSTNRLKVERSGSAISVYVNGYYLTTVYDGSLTGARKVGLGGATYSSGPAPIDIRFDNFQVCPIGTGAYGAGVTGGAQGPAEWGGPGTPQRESPDREGTTGPE
jgi:hypothetical protein